MRRGGIRRAAGAAAAALLLVWSFGPAAGARGAHHDAVASLVHVSSGDDWFNPDVISVARGGTVTWDFVGKTHHTATDTTGMQLYDSGSLLTGSYSYTFVAAGVYSFYCVLHPEMAGRIHVPMRARPSTGPRSTTFALTWASTVASSGFGYDVDLKPPGGSWTRWQNDVSVPSGPFDPHSGRGVYRFRARLHRTDTGQTSLWSDTVTISVT